MTGRHLIWLPVLGMLLVTSGATNCWSGEQTPTETVPVSMLVSVEMKHGKDMKEMPVINKEDVRVLQGHDRLRVTDWIPLQGEHAGLDLLILIDEATDQTVANQFDDLRRFMSAQPPTTAIAVGYMEDGTVRLTQNFTTDHEAAGKALRIPLGGFFGGNSPYLSVTDVIKRWPESNSRHVIFMVSDGIDPLQPGITDTYLDDTIETAQRTGTQIYAIFAARAGHFGHTFWRISQGQNNLSKLADQTGGEAYFQGFSTPIAFAPFLDEFAERLNHQFLLTFLIKPEKKPTYQHVMLQTEVPNAELVGPDKVYVPGSK
jgi:hypothetical protein